MALAEPVKHPPVLGGTSAVSRARTWYLPAGLAIVILLPVLAVAGMALFPAENIWPLLWSSVLPGQIIATAELLLGVGILTIFIGTGTAWLTAMCAFPGRRLFAWMLLLPLAMPTYIIAYAAADFLDYSGALQTALRELFGWQSSRDYWFPHIRTLPGAVAVMGLALYPYVYLTARSAFLEQSVCVLEAGRTLGHGPWGVFWRIGLPLARPSIVAGASLALMESLNDFGTVEHFAVQTLTRGIFETWLGMGNRGGAAQIALVMLVFVVILIALERWSRRRQRYFHTSRRLLRIERLPLTGSKAWAAVLACSLPIVLGFVVPVGVLLSQSLGRLADADWPVIGKAALNSLTLASIAGLAALAAGLVLAYGLRLTKSTALHTLLRFATLGYAVPGAVLAIGVLFPLAAFDNWLDDLTGGATGLLLTGSIFTLVYAYVVRFTALSFGTIEAGLGRITPSMDMAARTLGRSPAKVLRDVHLPLIRGSMITAVLLVFVDVMKELPATLLLRPFNFETLATHVYTYASLEQLDEAAPAALAIVAAGLLPVILLARIAGRARAGGGIRN